MKKVDFLFVYEVKNRELDSICLLAAYLMKSGYTVEFINSWKSLYKIPPKYDAKVVVLSACYNDGTYDYFSGHAAKFEKVVNLQWEELLENHFYENHEKEFADYSGVALDIQHACWGGKIASHLNEMYGIPPKNLPVLGYIPLDFYRPEFEQIYPRREEFFKQSGMDPNKETLLFVSSFTAVDFPDTEVTGSEEYWVLQEQIARKSQKIILEWFENIIISNPDIQIVYRSHPAESKNTAIFEMAEKNENFFVIDKYPIRYWILTCDKVYNWLSTSHIELLYGAKETYVLRPLEIPHGVDIPIFSDVNAISTFEEFYATLENEFSTKKVNISDSILQWYSIEEMPAYRRVGDWLINVYKDDTYYSRQSQNNIHKKIMIRKAKTLIKNSFILEQVIRLIIAVTKNTKFNFKIDGIYQNLLEQKKYERARRQKNGYIRLKAAQNYADRAEIFEKIYKFLEVIS